jgi:hypothetical protein
MSMENLNTGDLVRIRLRKPASIVKETLTRLGIGDSRKRILYQTCHLIKIESNWYIVHFKEIYGFLGKEINWIKGDLERRNKICELLEFWGMLDIVNKESIYQSYGIDIFNDSICDDCSHDKLVPLTYEICANLNLEEEIEYTNNYCFCAKCESIQPATNIFRIKVKDKKRYDLIPKIDIERFNNLMQEEE